MEGSAWHYGHAPASNEHYSGDMKEELMAGDVSHSNHLWDREDGLNIAEPVVEIKTGSECLEDINGAASEHHDPEMRPVYPFPALGVGSDYNQDEIDSSLLYSEGNNINEAGLPEHYQNGAAINPTMNLPKHETVDEDMVCGKTDMLFSHSILEPETADHQQSYMGMSNISSPDMMKSEYNTCEVMTPRTGVPSNQTDYYHGRNRSACAFCGEMFTHVIAHMMTAHSDAPLVAEAMSYEKGSAQRRSLFIALKNKGNYLYNQFSQKGEEMPFSPEKEKNPENPNQKVACKYCSRLYKPHKIRYHYMKCAAYKESTNHNTFTFRREMRKQDHYKKCMNILQSFPFVNEKVASEILARMRQDKITMLILNDPLLLKYAEVHIQGDVMPSFLHKIKQDLRNLGKLILTLREKDETIQYMADVLKPSSFGLVVRCVQEHSGFNSVTCSYERISTPMNIGYVLRKCAELLKTDALKSMDDGLVQQCNEFSELMINDWKDCMNLDTARSKKRERLPLLQDIQKLQHYFDKEMNLVIKKLNETQAASHWRRLSRLTLASIVLFNRGSSRKIDRMTMDDFESGCSSETVLPELDDKLSQVERQSVSSLTKISILESPSKNVPILLKPIHMQAVKLLNGLRDTVGVVDNPYIFARPGGETPLRGDVIREFAHRAGLEQPNNITPSNLRKHVIITNHLSEFSQTHEAKQMDTDLEQSGENTFKAEDYGHYVDSQVPVTEGHEILKVNISEMEGDSVLHPNNDNEFQNIEELQKKEFNFRDNGSRYWFLEYNSSDFEFESGNDSDYEPNSRRTKARGTRGRKMGPRKRMSGERTKQAESTSTPSILSPQVKVRHYVRGKTRKRYTYCRWSDEEESVVLQNMEHHFKCGTLPGKQECLKLLADNSILQKRKWEDLKNFVRNKLVSLARTNSALQNSVREFCSTAVIPHSSS